MSKIMFIYSQWLQ